MGSTVCQELLRKILYTLGWTTPWKEPLEESWTRLSTWSLDLTCALLHMSIPFPRYSSRTGMLDSPLINTILSSNKYGFEFNTYHACSITSSLKYIIISYSFEFKK